jgi:glycosyltransferase involved in cell wall biosynthesis
VPGFLERFDVALVPMQKTVLRKDGVDIARWTSPMKLFEYMSVGKVIVGSDLPVIREVLEQEANALLVEPEDIDGWCAAIRRLAGDPGRRNALATEAKARFLKFHTWSARASEVIDPSPDYKVG